MSYLYLLALLGSMFCMGLVDHRFKLFAFRIPRTAALTVVIGIVLFISWDLVAISLDIYTKGESPHMTGIDLAPHLPVEELVFITFLCYITGVLHGLMTLLLDRVAPSGSTSLGRRQEEAR